jgi:hypothetical protein
MAVNTATRQVLLYQDEDGVWIAEVPSLPGCGSGGVTREEAIDSGLRMQSRTAKRCRRTNRNGKLWLWFPSEIFTRSPRVPQAIPPIARYTGLRCPPPA